MKTKHLAALILALMMMLSLFSACADAPADDDQDIAASDDAQKPADDSEAADDKDESADDAGDAPVEREPITITLMNRMELGRSGTTFEEAKARGDALLTIFEDTALNEYGVIIDRINIAEEAYKTNLSGYIAAGELPDVFVARDLDAETLYNLVNNGLLADYNEVFEYSDGTAYNIYFNGGCMELNRATNTLEDGGWYWLHTANCTQWGMDLDGYIDGGYITDMCPITSYPVNIRYDWLQKLGMDIPSTMDQVYEALVAMRENDMNGNGVGDERAMFGMGTKNQAGFTNYYGLQSRWTLNANDGTVVVPELQPGFLPYLEFCKSLYDAQVAYLNEGGTWNYSVDVAGDYCSAHVQYPSTLQFPETGDPNATYMPIPPIQAVEGVKPTYRMQTVASNQSMLASSADANYDGVARFMDFINSRTYSMGLTYGVEGKAWEVIDGKLVTYQLTEEESDVIGYGNGFRFSHAGYGPQVTLSNLYAPSSFHSDDVDELLDSGILHSSWGTLDPTYEAWVDFYSVNYPWVTNETVNACQLVWEQIKDFGVENILFDPGTTSFYSFATMDESAVISKYDNDLNTYLDEIGVNIITGVSSPDQYEEQLQFAYDTLGLQEMIDMYQARANRAYDVIGLEIGK